MYNKNHMQPANSAYGQFSSAAFLQPQSMVVPVASPQQYIIFTNPPGHVLTTPYFAPPAAMSPLYYQERTNHSDSRNNSSNSDSNVRQPYTSTPLPSFLRCNPTIKDDILADLSKISINDKTREQPTQQFCMPKPRRVSIFPPNYKTKMCKNYLKGSCRMGPKCNFAHGYDEMRETTSKPTRNPRLMNLKPSYGSLQRGFQAKSVMNLNKLDQIPTRRTINELEMSALRRSNSTACLLNAKH